MPNSENKPKKKAPAKKTTARKSPAKKPATRKPATKKTSSSAKKPAQRKAPAKRKPAAKKSTINVKDIPVGLRESGKNGSANLDNSIVTNKRKKRKKKSKLNAEKVFWVVIAVIVLGAGIFGVFFIFQDYTKDPSTPAQLEVEKISDDNLKYIEGLGASSNLIEEVKATEQGPIIYVIYTTKAGTPKADVMSAIGEAYKTAISDKPDLFETYSFQITVVTSDEEAEGVNDYPLMGAVNAGRTGVSWMSVDGKFEEPVTETTE